MSAELCLTLFATVGIQGYVFQSNRLKENAGASYLVRAVLDEWLHERCRAALAGDVAWSNEPGPLRLPDVPNLQAERVYSGGGNAAVLFRSREAAARAVHAWSRKLLLDAPGLRVAVAHEPFTPGGLAAAWRDALVALRAAEEGPPPTPPLEGLSFTRACRSTGRAAAGWEAPDADPNQTADLPLAVQRARRCLSPVAAARLAAAPAANAALRSTFAAVLGDQQDFPEDVEKLGQREGEQHLAVVHADGNGLGARFSRILDGGGADAALVRRVRAFSASLQEAADSALAEIIAWLVERSPHLRDRGLVRARRGDRVYLPIRPILAGGDDLTFVSHGRLGLALAKRYLECFAHRRDAEGEPLSACAGVAIVHSRAPFARAYALADELCRSAKRWSRLGSEAGSSWLDAHLGLESVGEPLAALRERRVVPSGGALDWRPWRVTPEVADDRAWGALAARLDEMGQWPVSVRRGLMDSLAAGPVASQAAISHLRSRGRSLPTLRTVALTDSGWTGRTDVRGEHESATPYYEPLELLDYAWEVTV